MSPKNKTGRPGAKLSAVTSRKNPISLKPQNGQSPPTNDPGPRQLREEKSSLSREIIRLQNELEVYVQKVEALANRGKTQQHHLTLGFYLTETKVQLPLFLQKKYDILLQPVQFSYHVNVSIIIKDNK